MHKEFICIVCPTGCRLRVQGDAKTLFVSGNKCRRGEEYAKNEALHPVRMLTGLVCVRAGAQPVVSVRTSAPIPRQALMPAALRLRELCVEAPVAGGEVIEADFCSLGVDLIATRAVKRCAAENGAARKNE